MIFCIINDTSYGTTTLAPSTMKCSLCTAPPLDGARRSGTSEQVRFWFCNEWICICCLAKTCRSFIQPPDIGRFWPVYPASGRTCPGGANKRLRTIHRFESANSTCNCAVFLAPFSQGLEPPQNPGRFREQSHPADWGCRSGRARARSEYSDP